MKIITLIEKNEQGNKEMVSMLFLFHSPCSFPCTIILPFSLLCFLGIFRNVKLHL